jgi:N-acetylmuramoyl-L-alanine amidase
VAEKDVVLAFAKTFKAALEKTGQYKVVLTRESDTFLPLEKRVKIARDNKADLFLVIHADTLTGPLLQRSAVRGLTLYTVSDKASDAEADALAQKENRADIIAGVDLGGKTPEVSNVLINLAQRESRAEALKFAGRAIAEARSETHITGQPMRSAAFVVLKAPDVASVLIELGYLSNAEDEAQLTSEEWRGKMSAAFTRAINGFFGQPAIAAAN